MALFFDIAALAWAVRERLVLQRTLSALVAHWAVERMVGEEKFEDALVGPLHLGSVGADDLAVSDRGHARHDHHRSAWALDFDQTLATHAHGLHP